MLDYANTEEGIVLRYGALAETKLYFIYAHDTNGIETIQLRLIGNRTELST